MCFNDKVIFFYVFTSFGLSGDCNENKILNKQITSLIFIFLSMKFVFVNKNGKLSFMCQHLRSYFEMLYLHILSKSY